MGAHAQHLNREKVHVSGPWTKLRPRNRLTSDKENSPIAEVLGDTDVSTEEVIRPLSMKFGRVPAHRHSA